MGFISLPGLWFGHLFNQISLMEGTSWDPATGCFLILIGIILCWNCWQFFQTTTRWWECAVYMFSWRQHVLCESGAKTPVQNGWLSAVGRKKKIELSQETVFTVHKQAILEICQHLRRTFSKELWQKPHDPCGLYKNETRKIQKQETALYEP